MRPSRRWNGEGPRGPLKPYSLHEQPGWVAAKTICESHNVRLRAKWGELGVQAKAWFDCRTKGMLVVLTISEDLDMGTRRRLSADCSRLIDRSKPMIMSWEVAEWNAGVLEPEQLTKAAEESERLAEEQQELEPQTEEHQELEQELEVHQEAKRQTEVCEEHFPRLIHSQCYCGGYGTSGA
ncbi:hypothetical protein BJV74DRAFT_839128 [Russula compacta]|nr:hypothetical protein BJV74DRAFT_839128 [Russula compacta]